MNIICGTLSASVVCGTVSANRSRKTINDKIRICYILVMNLMNKTVFVLNLSYVDNFDRVKK